jgi:dsDNA-specific endonuclease/ATPase MutS2
MYKIKIIQEIGTGKLETKVNDFIMTEKRINDIKFANVKDDHTMYYTAYIIYEE